MAEACGLTLARVWNPTEEFERGAGEARVIETIEIIYRK
jgi:hypothetical protein